MFLKECLSHSAVTTKFMQHTSNGRIITSDLRATMEDVCERSVEKKYDCTFNVLLIWRLKYNCTVICRERTDELVRGIEVQLDNMEQDLSVLTTEIRDRINQMTQEVELKVRRHFLLILPRAMCKGFSSES